MRMRVKQLIGAAVAGAVALGLAGTASAQDAALVKKGEGVYASAAPKCQMCHSIDGKGNKKFPLDGVGKKLTKEQIREWLANPAAMHAKQDAKPAMKMPAYTKLPAADVDALVAYLESLK